LARRKWTVDRASRMEAIPSCGETMEWGSVFQFSCNQQPLR
jgi:hypothetical protein